MLLLFDRDDEFTLDYPVEAPPAFTFQIQLSQIDGQILESYYLPDEKGVPRTAESGKKDVRLLKEVSRTQRKGEERDIRKVLRMLIESSPFAGNSYAFLIPILFSFVSPVRLRSRLLVATLYTSIRL